MYNIGNQNSGEFEFVVRIPLCPDISGRLEWMHVGTNGRDVTLFVEIFLHDDRLESSKLNTSGKWEVTPTAHILIDTSRDIIKGINIYGQFQQSLLERDCAPSGM